jgi:RimJ/RimL family protein N-acetyltransferase
MPDLPSAPLPPLSTPLLLVRELEASDIAPLALALWDPDTWVVRVRGVDTPERVVAYLGQFLAWRAAGTHRPVVALDRATGERAALSVFHNATPGLAKVEIGFTWVATRWQRTHVNTSMKRLMMGHAFEAWGARRVEFYVDPRNAKSNTAMARLGAVHEGCLRKVRFLNDNDPGHRNIYSVLDEEWPAARERLDRLAARNTGKY